MSHSAYVVPSLERRYLAAIWGDGDMSYRPRVMIDTEAPTSLLDIICGGKYNANCFLYDAIPTEDVLVAMLNDLGVLREVLNVIGKEDLSSEADADYFFRYRFIPEIEEYMWEGLNADGKEKSGLSPKRGAAKGQILDTIKKKFGVEIPRDIEDKIKTIAAALRKTYVGNARVHHRYGVRSISEAICILHGIDPDDWIGVSFAIREKNAFNEFILSMASSELFGECFPVEYIAIRNINIKETLGTVLGRLTDFVGLDELSWSDVNRENILDLGIVLNSQIQTKTTLKELLAIGYTIDNCRFELSALCNVFMHNYLAKYPADDVLTEKASSIAA